METITDYQKQGIDFLASTGTKMTVSFIKHGIHWPGDKDERDIYRLTFTRGGQRMCVRFGQSLAHSSIYDRRPPTAYDVLACLTKNDPGTFKNFCDEFGYSEDSISMHRTYKAVKREWESVERVFGDVLSDLQEVA